MSYEIADILDAAADVIERDGWHQGDYYPGASQFWNQTEAAGLPKCVRGALRTITSSKEESAAEQIVATLGLDIAWRSPAGCLPEWNDAPERTQQEVLDTLRLAAKRERVAEDGAA